MSSTCFEHLSVHPQEDMYMQFYGISFMRPYKQSGRWKDVLDTSIEQTAYMELIWGQDFPHLSRLAPEPIQPPVQWVLGLYRG